MNIATARLILWKLGPKLYPIYNDIWILTFKVAQGENQ